MTRLSRIDIDAPPSAMEAERRAAVRDLLQDNSFALLDDAPPGPYALGLAMREGRIVFALSAGNAPAAEFHLSLGPLRQVIKDYFQICAAHAEAVRHLPPARIEAIDMARRGIHNEGADLLQDRLAGKARMDRDTARRLFTLICAMQR
ncbi:UPF0262 family protein [Falsirhodobacter algicola]|uniref:UPF0262 family protein n=1 Tax=Falsirhodobacter algicola TaxID=2692330 RepID=A0A8J8SK63_9RHOB|nr:UPF0262 family protein [Falsirhodobacter algicola]QUS35186.1 UPF0262 family protein [Falsirhodobacter algicola]